MMINGQEDICAVKRVSQLADIYVCGTGGRSKEKYPHLWVLGAPGDQSIIRKDSCDDGDGDGGGDDGDDGNDINS